MERQWRGSNASGSKGSSQAAPTKPGSTKLLVFDEEDSQIVEADFSDNEFENDKPAHQLKSILSMTEMSRIQRRLKVNEYINERKSLGISHPRLMEYNGDEPVFDQAALMNELGSIENVAKSHRENELFILAFNRKPEPAINDFISKGIIPNDSPDAIAAYLIKVEGLDKELLGEYFGKNDPKKLQVLHCYCKLLNFHGVEFDRAIRQLLARFRLPGESQQIERIIWQFSLAYYEANSDVHANADELFPLAYAIIMLATDAHNPKQEKKMSKEDFIRNTQRPCPSISAQYLGGVYDRITREKFETEVNYMETLYARLRGISSNDLDAILKLTKQLMGGDVFLKMCRSNNKFVQRKVYLSADESRIEWVSDPPRGSMESPRSISIKEITGITIGLGSQVMKKSKVPHQFDSLCFSIISTHRTLDLKAKTNKERSNWINYIRGVLIHRRDSKIEELEKEYRSRINRESVEQIWNTEIFPHWDVYWDYKAKRPKEKGVFARGFEALCCYIGKPGKNSSQGQSEFESQGGQGKGISMKGSLLGTLWKLGLPPNSRKVLWPIVIGNNLALTTPILEDIKKRVKQESELRKFTLFNAQVIEMAQICREFRPDIPAVRDIVQISQIFWKAFPRVGNQPLNAIIPLLNELHVGHFLPFFRGDKFQILSMVDLFQYLMGINVPKVREHFQGLKLETRMFLVSWFLSIFYDCFNGNEELLLRVWDNFLLEGELYLFKVGIAIIKYYEVELQMCTFHEGLKLLRFPKNTNAVMLFKILEEDIDVQEEHYNEKIQKFKNAVIKTKVLSIPIPE